MTGPEAEPPQYVAAHVHERLARDERLAALDVQVRVVGQKVFLSGVVSTDARRDVVTEIVHEEIPGYEVHNEIVVAARAEASTAETERLT